MEEYEEYIKCKACGGRGYHPYMRVKATDIKKFEFYKECCDVCKGWGKITWLENIFGVLHNNCNPKWESYD